MLLKKIVGEILCSISTKMNWLVIIFELEIANTSDSTKNQFGIGMYISFPALKQFLVLHMGLTIPLTGYLHKTSFERYYLYS